MGMGGRWQKDCASPLGWQATPRPSLPHCLIASLLHCINQRAPTTRPSTDQQFLSHSTAPQARDSAPSRRFPPSPTLPQPSGSPSSSGSLPTGPLAPALGFLLVSYPVYRPDPATVVAPSFLSASALADSREPPRWHPEHWIRGDFRGRSAFLQSLNIGGHLQNRLGNTPLPMYGERRRCRSCSRGPGDCRQAADCNQHRKAPFLQPLPARMDREQGRDAAHGREPPLPPNHPHASGGSPVRPPQGEDNPPRRCQSVDDL
ncbi:hypothetical protein BDK51DRAFT_49690 [Blyttiomyces helicus]|uniref:Uncharacterized protein n=1 Tax=Blyttiomyces helicus TaxID=388810 RepID=A0A4P9WHQ8_9FUNG|nr:hypothetical protein BDK51DRAFT_49690 [Blyttiomyces helicus]|eukprot:RKO91495.1 hypothetical protein BDK51DRAFT_49690 [Blyttiomyces helicus]